MTLEQLTEIWTANAYDIKMNAIGNIPEKANTDIEVFYGVSDAAIDVIPFLESEYVSVFLQIVKFIDVQARTMIFPEYADRLAELMLDIQADFEVGNTKLPGLTYTWNALPCGNGRHRAFIGIILTEELGIYREERAPTDVQ